MSKTGGIVVAEIKMIATSFDGHFLMIEGDDDSKFWKTRIDRNNCQLVITQGKDHLLDASKLLDNSRFTKALGVVDLDYDWSSGVTYSSRIQSTDLHDIEMMMLDSDALDKVLVEHGDAEKIQRFESREQMSVFDALMERALPFGLLRWYNYLHLKSTSVCFDDLRPYRFVDKNNWILDVEALQSEFVKQASCRSSSFDINHLMRWLSIADGDPRLIVQGHDALCILAQGLKSVLGNAQFSDSALAKSFRLAYEQTRFEKTNLCAFVREWERNHNISVFLMPLQT